VSKDSITWATLSTRTNTLTEIRAFLEEGGIVLTPAAKLARAIREDFESSLSASQVVATPQIFTADKWLEDLWRAQAVRESRGGNMLLSDTQELHVWRRVILESEEADRLLQVGAAARLAMDAWRTLHAWKIPWTAAVLDQQEDTAAFFRWSRRYSQICEQKKWTDRARFAEEIEAAGAQVVVAGFGGTLSPGLRMTLDRIAPDWREIEAFEPCPAPMLSSAEFSSVSEEVRAAAEWAREALRANPEARIAVVSTDLPSQRRLLERVFLEVLHPDQLCFDTSREDRAYAVSGAEPLARHPLVHSALLALRLAKGDLPLADAGSFMRSPFLGRALQERTARAVLDVALRQTHPSYLSAQEIQEEAKAKAPVLATLMTKFDKQRRALPKAVMPSSWASHVSKLLRSLDWPGSESLSAAENQVIELWHEALSEYASLDAITGTESFASALQSIEDLARSKMLPVREVKRAGIWILNVHEAAGLPFNYVWVCGCTVDAWPRPARPNPFLPIALQRTKGVPGSSAALELESARSASRQLMSLSEEAVFSYATRDGDRELRKSPLIEGLPPIHAQPPAEWLAWAAQGNTSLEELTDTQGPALGKGVKQRGGTRILLLQAACPFRAFVELRLGSRAMESSEAGLNPRDRGKMLHEVLRLVWNQIQTSARLQQATEAELDEIIKGAIRKSQWPARDVFDREVLKLEAVRLHGLIREWLAEEKKRSPFVVVGQEQKRTVEFGGLKFEARMDRIDRLPDGRELILDYKTGDVSSAAWDGARPDEPQLPAYAVSHTEPVGGVAFAAVSRGAMRLEGILPWNKTTVPLEDWRGTLFKLAADFAAGKAEVDPKRFPQSCQYCDVAPVCRIGDERRGAE
jgi:ATP-dependent helicase/nuclease subunit B